MKEASPSFTDVETEREAEVKILKRVYQPTSCLHVQLSKYLNSRSTSDQTFKFENASESKFCVSGC